MLALSWAAQKGGQTTFPKSVSPSPAIPLAGMQLREWPQIWKDESKRCSHNTTHREEELHLDHNRISKSDEMWRRYHKAWARLVWRRKGIKEKQSSFYTDRLRKLSSTQDFRGRPRSAASSRGIRALSCCLLEAPALISCLIVGMAKPKLSHIRGYRAPLGWWEWDMCTPNCSQVPLHIRYQSGTEDDPGTCQSYFLSSNGSSCPWRN
jgi:hypothetical protein